jgi:hypothetical protein
VDGAGWIGECRAATFEGLEQAPQRRRRIGLNGFLGEPGGDIAAGDLAQRRVLAAVAHDRRCDGAAYR